MLIRDSWEFKDRTLLDKILDRCRYAEFSLSCAVSALQPRTLTSAPVPSYCCTIPSLPKNHAACNALLYRLLWVLISALELSTSSVCTAFLQPHTDAVCSMLLYSYSLGLISALVLHCYYYRAPTRVMHYYNALLSHSYLTSDSCLVFVAAVFLS